MTLRFTEIHRLLKPTGSFYLHCDPTASHYLKLVLDSIFVTQGGDYRNEITWKRRVGMSSAVHDSNRFGSCTDIIFFYVKSKDAPFNPQYNKDSPEYQAYIQERFTSVDEKGRRFQATSLVNPGYRPNLIYEYKGYQPPANGWMITKEKMEQWDAEGRIHFPASKTGRLRRKSFVDELRGMPIQNLWTDIPEINSRAAERLGYPTQKPEALLERIIAASSNPGDTVFDAYCGCGTTIAVAQRLGRSWIGIDITYQSIGVILKRLIDSYGKEIGSEVVLNGIPRDMDSARALALKKDDRVRKEFEKWAVLTFSRHQASINSKKGADGGVDGLQFFPVAFGSDEMGKVLYQVKSGGVGRKDISQLRGDMLREGAQLGVFLTLDEPSAPMRIEAASAGTFELPLMGRNLPVITIATIREMVENGARLELPISHAVHKKAAAQSALETQIALDLSGD